MAFIDYLIITFYLLGMVLVGLYFQKKASKGIDSYFLGDRSLPWWVLGASGMASNLDVSGTMINVAFLYALGASGFFIEIRGGIVLIMAFLMIFMGKWNRRAKVMTLAEWMEFRFGSDTAGKIARLISAIAILLSTTAIVTYFAVGGGKFIGELLGIPEIFGIKAEFWAALIMIFLAMIYTVTSGLYGVVWTDVFQGILIFASIIIICYISFTQFILPATFQISVPLKQGGFITFETTKELWTNIIPKWQLNIPQESAYSIYNLFGIAIIFYLIKTVIEGSGGTSGYMLQRFFAAKSD
ncbi:MAG: sodium:solute symporter, partial [Ignavibacteriales bacterium]|nr:sodium:solute symporter [Ignavibacteriales bacterium]